MNDFDAAEWLNYALDEAQRNVEDCKGAVRNKQFLLHMAEGHLEQAEAKVDAIRLIRSRSGLEGSAKPADDTATGNRKKGHVAQTDHD